jgi:hypothetical protein
MIFGILEGEFIFWRADFPRVIPEPYRIHPIFPQALHALQSYISWGRNLNRMRIALMMASLRRGFFVEEGKRAAQPGRKRDGEDSNKVLIHPKNESGPGSIKPSHKRIRGGDCGDSKTRCLPSQTA